MRIVIATHNRKKAGEMTEILSSRFPLVEFVTLADFEGAPEPEETGTTYVENAVIKADSACQFTGEWCLADDAGLEVSALDGAPGVYSKRFGGEDLPFPLKISKLLALLEGVSGADRAARFVCSVAFARPGFATESFLATCEGEIALAPRGAGGFGYDPVFFLPSLGRSMAELTAAEKHAVSHRGKVLGLVSSRLGGLL